MTAKPATSQAEPARGGRSGWQDPNVKASRNRRISRAKQAAELKRSRVQGDDHTPAELEALRDERKADTKARNPGWFK